MSTSPDPRGWRDTFVGAAVLVGVLAATVAAALVLGNGRPLWGRAVAFAALVSGAGGLGGWLVARHAAAAPGRRSGLALGATALRLAPGLAGLAWLGSQGGPLREAGAGGLLVAFYLALLAATILLHMMVDQRGFRPRSDARR